MLATKKNNGEITTPAFAVNGNATLTFNAAAQEGDIETLRNNNKVYDLQGREVKAPGKGIYCQRKEGCSHQCTLIKEYLD